MKKTTIGVLLSGRGSNFIAIADACNERRVDGEIVAVGSDNPRSLGLAKAKKRGLYTFEIGYEALKAAFIATPSLEAARHMPEDFNYDEAFDQQSIFPFEEKYTPETVNFFCPRAIAEKQILDQFRAKGVELVVLAGFERLLTPYFISRMPNRIMNIHPSLLPAFRGRDGYGDTFRYGSKIGGCTVHFVDGGMDTGPIIGQMAYTIEPGDTLESVQEKGLRNEWQLFPRCIQLFADGRLEVVERDGRKIVNILLKQ